MIFYILGMVCYLASDIIVVKLSEGSEVVSKWAFVKAMLTLASVVAVFGSEQSILRFPQNLLKSYKKIILRTFIYAFIISILLTVFSPIDNIAFWYLSVLALSSIVLMYSILRTSSNFNTAMLFQNLWKILLLVFVVLIYFIEPSKLYLAFTVSLYASILINLFFLRKDTSWLRYYQSHSDEEVSNKYFFTISRFFIVSALTLNVSVSFEQLIFNILGLSDESALFLAHTSALLPIVLLFNGFASFYLGPYVKNNYRKLSIKKLSYLLFFCIFLGLVLAVISLILGYLFFKSFYINYDFNIYIGISVVLIGLLRIVYIIPSSFVGVIGRDDLTKKYITYNLVFIFFSIGVIFLFKNSNQIFEIIIIIGLLNWLYRNILGIYYSYLNLEKVD